MAKSRALVCLLWISVVSVNFSLGATSDRISGSLATGAKVALPGNVHHRALPQFDQGPVDPALNLGTISLLTTPTPAQQKALQQLLADQQNRKSQSYHKWLTPEQFADQFGLSQKDIQQIVAWLKAQGFTMVQPARGRNWVSFTGTAAQVQAAFGTEIHHYNVNGELHYANASAPKIPAALAGVATAFRGLDDFHPRPRAIRRTRPYWYTTAEGGADFLAPGDIATIYNIPSGLGGTGLKLAVMGQTDIYLADLNDFRTGFDLPNISCTTNGSGLITACDDPHFQYVLGGTDPGLHFDGNLEEADLDLEWTGAVAPSAQLIFVNSTDTFNSFYFAIDHNLAPVISLSYGLCEFDDQSQLPADENELQMANSEGITFVNSSGDSGVAECDNSQNNTGNLAENGLAVSFPASSPEVTGAGGSAVTLAAWDNPTYWGTSNGATGGSASGYVPEQGWNDNAELFQFCQQNTQPSDPGYDFCKQGGTSPQSGWVPITSEATSQDDIGMSASGGGGSNCEVQNSGYTQCVSGFPIPAWQQTLSVPGAPSGVRLSPDVSFFASPNFPGYIFCTPEGIFTNNSADTTSSCSLGINTAVVQNNSLIGGTSASAPVFAGIAILLNQYLLSTGFLTTPGLGNVNPTLYQLAATPSNQVFHPVTTSDNNIYCQPNTPSGQESSLLCPASGVFGYEASNSDTITGYNLVAGLGSINVTNLTSSWAAAAENFTLSASTLSPTSVAAGNTTTTTVTIGSTTGFTGMVTLSCTGPTGVSCSGSAASGGSTPLTIQTAPNTPVGTDTITIKGTSGGVTAQTTISLAVTATTETFSVTASPTVATLSVAQGQISGPVNLTVTSSSTPSFVITTGTSTQTAAPVTYTCSGTPIGATCIFAPSSPSSATSVSMTIQTTAPSAKLQRPMEHGNRIFYAVFLPGLLGIVLAFDPRKRAGSMRMLALMLALGCSTLWMASCGGNSSSSTVTNPGTPVGTSTITVNATAVGGTVVASPTVTFQLTVTQ